MLHQKHILVYSASLSHVCPAFYIGLYIERHLGYISPLMWTHASCWDHCSWRDLVLLLLHLFFVCGYWWALSSSFCWAEGLIAVESWGFSYVAICRLNLPFSPSMMWLSFESISSLRWNKWGCNLRSLSKRDIYSPCGVFLHRGHCRKWRLCMKGVALQTRNHLIVLCR